MPVYKLEDCEKQVDPKSVLTIIVDDEKMKKLFLERSPYEVKIKSEIEDVKTEYIFLGPFDKFYTQFYQLVLSLLFTLSHAGLGISCAGE